MPHAFDESLHPRDPHLKRFTEKPQSPPKGVELNVDAFEDDSPLSYEPGQPIRAWVEFHERENLDNTGPIAHQKVDIASILDTKPLAEVIELRDNPYAFSDDIVDTLRKHGALTHPDAAVSPLDLDLGDVEAYADYRQLRGQHDPIAAEAKPSVANLAAVVAARQDDIDNLRRQLADLEEEKEKAEERVIRQIVLDSYPDAKLVTVQLDHPKYPVELFDEHGEWVNIGEDGERVLAAEIRGALGDDPNVVGGRGTARVIELAEAAAVPA